LPAVLAYRPLLRIRDGQITAVDRVRTRLATAERLAELAAEFAGSRVVDVAVQYTAGAVDRAADLADRLTAAITQVHRLYLAEAGAAITAHTGLGMLGVALTPQWPADQAEASGEAPVQEASGETPVQADLPLLIETGLRLVGERLRSSPGFSIYLSIQRQLEYLHETVARGQVPTPEKLDSLTLGVYAAREFETSDPEFADMLFKVNYLANRMS
jgi:hypothetical protein